MSLEKVKAVITGAAMGIGRSVALRFVEEGAKVAVCDIAVEELQETLQAVRKISPDAMAGTVDVRQSAQVRDFMNKAEQHLGGVNCVVCSAGVRFMSPIPLVTEQEWEHTIGVNLTGAFYSLQAAVPAIRRMGGGSIVNIGSVSGLRGLANRAPYCSSKSGMHGLTRQAAAELAPLGIRVNAVAPGFTDTPIAKMFDGEVVASIAKLIPLKRRATRDEIADFVVFLASDAASYITGSILPIDGGLTECIEVDAWPWKTDPAIYDRPL
jgi:NAD(P)-dependent dehydrogenase (short-subunit alcohol dehydrogenase family)